MRFVIKPYRSAGKIKLGSTITEVKNVMKTKPETFKKTESDEYETDFFREDQVFVYYKHPGVCEAVEFGSDAKVFLFDKNVFKLNFGQMKEIMQKKDRSLEFDDSGFISYKFGVGIYAPDYREDNNCRIESVIVFEKNYYNKK